ncbi:hypothetical protein NPIL_667291 [Nephila pilipes]|uniref:Uncharacterized protein n=1 Tax=Nephila pilipes TaxID=299642 RepID=A0A8X6TN91_NEPPI|nr:hypothetical protein NPIL_667291 [Nephila pilipes]
MIVFVFLKATAMGGKGKLDISIQGKLAISVGKQGNSRTGAPEAPWASNGCVATEERQQDYGRLSLIRLAKSTTQEMTQKRH